MEKENTSTEDVELQDDSTTVDADKDESTDSSSTELDLDAELEAEKQRGKPDPKIAAEAFKKRQEKRKEEDEDTEEDVEDKPLTRKDLASIRESVHREVYGDRIKEVASELTADPKEAQLILAMHANRSFPQGTSIKEQLGEMLDIVESKRLRAKSGELARALRGKDTVTRTSTSTHRDAQRGSEPQMSAQDKMAYKEAGFVFDVKDRVYKKKLPNGKTLIKDPKTKQSVVV